MEITHTFNDFLLTNTKELTELTSYFMCAGFVITTFTSLLGYGIFKALSLVNIINK